MNAHSKASNLRLGLRAHDLGCLPAGELARLIAALGVDCVQLAPGKAIEGVEMKPGLLSSGLASEIRGAFAEHHIGIEVLGCYINPIHPVHETRRSLLDLFKDHLRHAREFGCNIVALESGSLNADYSPHPGNLGEPAFRELLASMEELVAEAECRGVVVGIEAVTSHVISSPERMIRLLDAIPSPHLQVVCDPVNLLNAENHAFQREIIRRSLDGFGERIAVIHAKDFMINDGRMETRPAGRGMLDYGWMLAHPACRRPGLAILLEDLRPEEIVPSGNFIRSHTQTVFS